MKTASKKLLCLLMAVFLLAAAVPFQAFATETHTLTINIEGDTKGTATLTTDPSNPVTKTELDEAVYRVIEKDDYTITGYYDATGSTLLSDYDSLNQSDISITVKVQLNTPATTPSDAILTLDAGDGTIDGTGGKTATYTMTLNAYGTYDVPTLPTASLSGYNFKGWYVGDSLIEGGTTKLSGSATAVAKYELKTKNLLVKGMKTTQSAEDAVLISEYNVAVGTSLLTFLNQTDVTAAVKSSVPTGYSLVNNSGSILWYSSDGSTLTSQAAATDVAQTVLVKYQANSYTLYFQVDGGSVSPTSKTVTYDQKVGTLPTPTRTGDVFLGWFDADGTQYTSDTVYKVAGNTTLYARWQSEATVLLRIYLEDNTTTADRIVDITGKVVGNSITRSEVETIVLKYYSAQSGKTMKLVGLFNDNTWADYKAGNITTGDPNVTIQENTMTNVYVVVKNAQEGATTTTTTSTDSTSTADSSNPKTGDTMLIYPAAAVMVLAAAALVTVQIVRKKKF